MAQPTASKPTNLVQPKVVVTSPPVVLKEVWLKGPLKALRSGPAYLGPGQTDTGWLIALDRAAREVVVTDPSGVTTYIPLHNVEAYRR